MTSRLRKTLAASFLVYLLPIVGAHMALPLGAILVAEVTEGNDRREPAWIAADVALAITLQVIAGLVAYWFFDRPSWRRFLASTPIIPILWAGLMWSYLLVIPQYFLVDSNHQPDIASWEEECRVPDAYLVAVNSPMDLSLEQAGMAFVAVGADADLAMLRMPGCEVEPYSIRWSNYSPRVHSITATRAVLYSVHDKASDIWSWWVVGGPGEEAREIVKPQHTGHSQPILSSGGGSVAWVARVPDEGNRTRPVLLISDLFTTERYEIDLDQFSPASFRLVHFDAGREEVTVARNEEEFLTVGRDGGVRWGPWNPEGLKAWAGTLRRLEAGWAAWDAYRETDPYRVEWSLSSGLGEHELPRGYGIQSAAVDPVGRYIAVSVDGRYSFPMPDAVYVLRTADGGEVFRQSLPQYNRSQVAFLTEKFFAYTDERGVRVLRVRDVD